MAGGWPADSSRRNESVCRSRTQREGNPVSSTVTIANFLPSGEKARFGKVPGLIWRDFAVGGLVVSRIDGRVVGSGRRNQRTARTTAMAAHAPATQRQSP